MGLMVLMGARFMQTGEHMLVLPSGGPRICTDHNSPIILHSHDGGLTDRQTGYSQLQHKLNMQENTIKSLESLGFIIFRVME